MRVVVAAIALGLFASCAGKTANEPATAAPMYRPGPDATIPFRFVFDNRMSSTFRFERIDIRLDGGRVLTDEQHALVVEQVRDGKSAQFDVRLAPGDHVIRSQLTFIGSGQGALAYSKNYKFEIRTSRAFTAAPGGVVTMVAYEQDGPLEERPAVRYSESGMPAAAPSCSCPCASSSARP